MKDRFSIGEFARMAIIPTKTLRYYDEIGLFKPAEIDAKTGYRYYSIEQLEPLDMIKYLQYLGVSLSEIQMHLRKRKIKGFLDLLKEQAAKNEQAICELEQKKKCFQNRINEIEEALTMKKIGIPFIKDFQPQTVFRVEATITNRFEIEMALRKLAKLVPADKQFFIGMGKVGFELDRENLRKHQFACYKAIYVLLDDENLGETEYIHTLAAEKCACICYRGSFLESNEYYPQLLKYIADNGYTIKGDAHERIRIDPFMTSEESYLLREIRVPVEK